VSSYQRLRKFFQTFFYHIYYFHAKDFDSFILNFGSKRYLKMQLIIKKWGWSHFWGHDFKCRMMVTFISGPSCIYDAHNSTIWQWNGLWKWDIYNHNKIGCFVLQKISAYSFYSNIIRFVLSTKQIAHLAQTSSSRATNKAPNPVPFATPRLASWQNIHWGFINSNTLCM